MSSNKKTGVPKPKDKKGQIEEIKAKQQLPPQQLNALQQLVIAVNNQAKMLDAQTIDIRRLNAMVEIADKERKLLWKEIELLEKKLRE